MRSVLRVINFIGATILTALLFVSIAVGQLRGFPQPGPPVAPHTLTFPPQMVGTQSAAKTITVFANPSLITVVVSAPFQSGGCVRTSDNSCTINVTFAPVVVGPANAYAAIVERDRGFPGHPQRVTRVTLSGTGVASMAEKAIHPTDFNGDSKPDLVWQNQSNGAIGVWFMNGSNRISATNFSPGQIADTAWKIIGIADFNADSKPDLVWQNQSGHVWVWFMNGIDLINAANFSPGQVSDTTWKIVGTGDFNSDSKPDLVWQNQSDGQIGVWFMDGINLINATNFSPGQVSDLNWKIPNVWALQ